MKFHITLLAFVILFSPLTGIVYRGESSEILTDTVTYRSGDETVSAYIARPTGRGPFPALVVIHEWWGLNDWVKESTREFAENGYVALAVDLYRGRVAEDRDLAHELSRALPQDRAVRDMKAALGYLRRQPYVEVAKIGSIGWCMGGGYSLQLALNADLAATVIAYGRLGMDPDQLKKINSPLLGIFGEKDKGIPSSDVRKFEKLLNEQGVRNNIHIYDGAGHAFMNPNNSGGYNRESADDAWRKIYQFFDEQLM
jgi:carboxymethylenebutenolidase